MSVLWYEYCYFANALDIFVIVVVAYIIWLLLLLLRLSLPCLCFDTSYFYSTFLEPTCLTLFLDDETLNMPTVLSPCCSRCLMQVSTMGGTLGSPEDGAKMESEAAEADAAILDTASSRQLAKDMASNAEL